LVDSPHGADGEAWYSDGARYKGDWLKGKRDGWGVLSRPVAAGSGAAVAAATKEEEQQVTVYEGEWRDDCPHGRGRWTFEDGSGFFEGVFSGGVRVEGRLVVVVALAPSLSSSPAVDFDYTGPLHPEDGSRHGDQGACICPGRWEYRGSWRRGKRHSTNGLCRWPDGSRYEGPWIDDLPHGNDGTWTEANGDVSRGGFVGGRREGRGVWRSSGGEERYAGQWRQGEREGQGECWYADGGKYVGEWLKGKRHGRGRMRFADGAVFEGAWEEDAWVQGAADPRFCRMRGLVRTVVATGDGPGPAPVAYCGDGDADGAAFAPGWFLIAARDELGNARLSGGDCFSVVVEGPVRRPGAEEEEAQDENNINAVAADVLDAGNGTYRVRLPPTVLRRAGAYRVHVTDALSGEVVAGAPLALSVVPGPADARRCRLLPAAGSGQDSFSCLRLRSGEELEVRVQARDALGNLARARGAPWSVEAALVWRGPLQGRGCASSSASQALAETIIPLSIEVVDDGEDGGGSDGWVVRGRAPVAAAGGEFLLEVVAVAAAAPGHKKPTRTHLPGSPLLVVVVGEEAALMQQQQEEAPMDEARLWAERAAAADGGDDGDDGKREEEEPPGTSTAAERAFVAANPLVPVVENLRDLHLVSRVQAMREDERERRRRR
jgi:hypothetical protein